MIGNPPGTAFVRELNVAPLPDPSGNPRRVSLDPPVADPLVDEARAYARASREASTLRAYRSDWADFDRWCGLRSAAALPATPETVALYLAALARTHRPATIARRLTSITRAHRVAGHPTPAAMAHPEVREPLQGIRRTLGIAPRRKTALRTRDVRRALAGLRDRALLLVGFAGAPRRGNLAAVAVEHMVWSDEGILVHLGRSKTDPEGVGHILVLTRGAREDTCPVRAIELWLVAAGITGGPVFRAVDRNGKVRWRARAPRAVAALLKPGGARGGLDPAASAGHSLRAGFSTDAARGGATVWDIMRQTGHRSPATVARYVRDAEHFRDAPAARLGL